MESGSRAYGYTRVSTTEQGVSGLGLDAQSDAIHNYCTHREWVLADVSREVASGAKDKPRPVLADVLGRLTKGDVLVVAKADRLARSLTAYVRLIDMSKRGGWSIVAADGSIDLTTPHGRAMAAMSATFAELEAELIGDRTRLAMQAAKQRGARFGQPAVPLPEHVIEDIGKWRGEGRSLRSIAAELNFHGEAAPRGGKWTAMAVKRAADRYCV